MISYLTGEIIACHNNKFIVKTNNVGFEVEVVESKHDLSTFKNIDLYIYNVFLDNNTFLSLGFLNLESKIMFSHLMDIPGIGLKKSINILNTYTPFELLVIIQRKELAKLEAIKGLRNNDIHSIIQRLDKLYFQKKYNNIEKNTLEFLKKLGFNSEAVYKSMSNVPKVKDLSLFIKSVIQGIKAND